MSISLQDGSALWTCPFLAGCTSSLCKPNVCRRLSAAQMRFYTVERLSNERSLLGNRLLWARPSVPHSQWRAWHYRLVPLERDRSNRPLNWAPISLIDSQKSTARYKSISFALTPLIDILRRAGGTQWMSLWGATQTSCIWSWARPRKFLCGGGERERTKRERERENGKRLESERSLCFRLLSGRATR